MPVVGACEAAFPRVPAYRVGRDEVIVTWMQPTVIRLLRAVASLRSTLLDASTFYRSSGKAGGQGGEQMEHESRSPHGTLTLADAQEVEIQFNAGIFLRIALGGIAALAALGLLVVYLGYVREEGLPRLILRAFLLDEEQNLPTLFVFALLIFISILLALIGARAVVARQAFRIHWLLLAALFFFIAFDEAAMLHERFGKPIRTALDTSGHLYFAWIIPAGVLVSVLALLYLPFLRHLPAPFGRLFVLSGALYVGGALGVEMPGGAYFEAHGEENFTYQLIATIEETLEMLGLAIFAYALMRLLARGDGRVRVSFRAA